MAAMVQGSGEGIPLTVDAVDSEKNDSKKRRFLWGIRRMFKRKSREQESREPPSTPAQPTLRGRSSDHLLTDEDSPKRKRQQSGLSVSHDSVFTAEASGADSDEERSRPRLRPHAAVSAELAAAVRRRPRGDTSEEDEDLGLPRSPSPHKRGINRGRTNQSGAEQSSCSEGSLLSAGSSDPDDEFRSSKGDLTSVPPTPLASASSIPDTSDQDVEEPPSGLAPLSHSAARHKMAVRPRRTHGPPRRTKPTQMSATITLPTTPEVNEDVTRSATPEVISSGKIEITSSVQQYTSTSTNIQHLELNINHHYEGSQKLSQSSETYLPVETDSNQIPNDTRLKSSSLPAGLALNQLIGNPGASAMKFSLSTSNELNQAKITRSKSNAQKKDDIDNEENFALIEQQQSVSERNIPHQYLTKRTPYRSMDMKFTNLAGELQKKFGSVSEDEELLNSGSQEMFNQVTKHKKHSEKSYEKEHHYENVSVNLKDHRSKNQKEVEDVHEKTSKKEESFFGRLLLRKSGKRNKKEHERDEDSGETKKTHSKSQAFKSHNSENISSITDQKYNPTEHGVIRHHKMMCLDQHVHKSVGQKVFSNQSHKRIDPRGGYANDFILQESMNNYAKESSTEYGMNDMKHFSEREKLASDLQFSHGNIKIDDQRLQNADKTAQPRLRQRVEPQELSPESHRKPIAQPRLSLESKSFFPILNQGKVYPSHDGLVNNPKILKNPLPRFPLKDEHAQAFSPKIKVNSEVFSFESQSANQSPTFLDANNTKPVSYSVSPPRSIWPVKNDRSSQTKSSSQGSLHQQSTKKYDPETRYFDFSSQIDSENDHHKMKPKIAGLSSYQQKISHIGNQHDADLEFSYTESINSRNPVIKSHSFRLISDSSTIAQQQEMPSLPPTFGITESSMDSWESNYKRNVRESSEAPTSLELGSDSLMNYTIKPNNPVSEYVYPEQNLFIIPHIDAKNKDNLIRINEDIKLDLFDKQPKQISHYEKRISIGSTKVTDNDISRIEANIDSIIGSPKPLNCITLKSNSLDSVKSYTDKTCEQNRKAISNESISHNRIYINQTPLPNLIGSVNFNQTLNGEEINLTKPSDNAIPANDPNPSSDQINENHVSVTVLNQIDNAILDTTKHKSEIANSVKPSECDSPIDKTAKSQNVQRDNKTTEKPTASPSEAIPEFMKIQLNKVDQKPATNIVLSTSLIMDTKNKKTSKEQLCETINETPIKRPEIERSVSYEPKKSEKMFSIDHPKIQEVKEPLKPQRKFSSEDVEILEKADINIQNNNSFNVLLKKSGSQSLMNKNNDVSNVDVKASVIPKSQENKLLAPTNISFRKSSIPVSSLPPVSPTGNKNFPKKKSENDIDSVKQQHENEQKVESNANEANKISSQEHLSDHAMRNDRSSTSSDDTNLESTVILRKKNLTSSRNSNKKDDEPELMKVFARRSLKLKDSELDTLAQDILNNLNTENKEEENDELKKSNKYSNSLTRSRDSDKENEADSPKDERKKLVSNANDTLSDNSQVVNNNKNNAKCLDYRKHNTETAELMQAQRMPKKLIDSNPASSMNLVNTSNNRSSNSFVLNNYQRSTSINVPPQSSNTKVEKADNQNYKKETSDSTPEKRFRNRTFPDSNNEIHKEDGSKTASAKIEPPQIIDTSSLPKRPWNQIKTEQETTNKDIKALRKFSFTSNSNKINVEKPSEDLKETTEIKNNEMSSNDSENGVAESQSDGSPQFKGILQMRAEWERRAQQAMTK